MEPVEGVFHALFCLLYLEKGKNKTGIQPHIILQGHFFFPMTSQSIVMLFEKIELNCASFGTNRAIWNQHQRHFYTAPLVFQK